MHTKEHLIQQHHEWANVHRSHAQALHQQAQYHHQQAQLHQHQAISHAQQGMGYKPIGTPSPLNTAYNNQVSPAALVFHGSVSPQAMASLQQYQGQFSRQSNLSSHMAHATENQAAMQRGYRF